jgi:hypothetical protein
MNLQEKNMMNNVEDDDKILKDGERMTVHMFAMDGVATRKLGAGHRPGGLPVTDADRQRRRALHDAADSKLSERWKRPSIKSESKPPVTMADRDQRLSQRWRG